MKDGNSTVLYTQETHEYARLRGCERGSATGDNAIAHSNEIGLPVSREASREREVETDNKAG
jgi:hypothetical protein